MSSHLASEHTIRRHIYIYMFYNLSNRFNLLTLEICPHIPIEICLTL